MTPLPRPLPNSVQRFNARVVDSRTLPELLPWIVDSLSPARGQMLVDQLSKTLHSEQLPDLVIVVVQPSTGINSPHPESTSSVDTTASNTPSGAASNPVSGAAIALVSPAIVVDDEPAPVRPTATLLYAGLAPTAPTVVDPAPVTALLAQSLDRELADRGVRFLQWARDPASRQPNAEPRADANAESSSNAPTADEKASPEVRGQQDIWPETLGFQQLATLCYMHLELQHTSHDRAVPPAHDAAPAPSTITLVPVGHSDTDKLDFEALVERTYAGSLDCPQLSQFQTTAAVLAGYRSSPAFAPELWFEARSSSDVVVGCLVLARHGGGLEVVYMGVVPEQRGRGLGRALLAAAIQRARDEASSGVILAVDVANAPARDVYTAAGFRAVLFEEVWGKRLARPNFDASKNEST